jgi:transitional endoplasmic reticulum ATPase
MNKVAQNNLRVKFGDLVTVHQYLNIQYYGKRVHIVLFDDSIEGLSGNIFDVSMKSYSLDSKSLVFGDEKFSDEFFLAYQTVRKSDTSLVRSGMRIS